MLNERGRTMIYPKQLMSIKELKTMGFSEYQLRQFSHDPQAPVVRAGKRGQIKFDTTKLDDYLAILRNKKAGNNDSIPWCERKKRLFAN